jgi:hypothetical protein
MLNLYNAELAEGLDRWFRILELGMVRIAFLILLLIKLIRFIITQI